MSTRTLEEEVQAIRDAFESLDYNDVDSHFACAEDDEQPYVVCRDVTVDAFNEYIRLEEDENDKLPVALRFLDLDEDGRILIVEW
ncbi:hypothetical protein DYB36_006125 [Aphanomyces astaci]|uniref:Uncharacterized protein n=1 Tax=Aphanomyces astaci TaxID=112090 RepID=A0A396ZYN6_APHAT|nr:hypothetical protein DYB36_006125 [Aphanomyces astaci]